MSINVCVDDVYIGQIAEPPRWGFKTILQCRNGSDCLDKKVGKDLLLHFQASGDPLLDTSQDSDFSNSLLIRWPIEQG